MLHVFKILARQYYFPLFKCANLQISLAKYICVQNQSDYLLMVTLYSFRSRKSEAEELHIPVKRLKSTRGVYTIHKILPTDQYGPEPSGPEPSGPMPSGPEPSRPEPSGPKPSGPEPSGPEPFGPEPSRPEPPGPESSGPESSGPESAGPEQPGPKPSGPEPTVPDPYNFNDSDSEDNVPLCKLTYENALKVKFQTQDVCVLGKTSKTYEFVKILEVFPEQRKLQVMYLEKKRSTRQIAPFNKGYKDSFRIRFNHLVYRLSNKEYLSVEEEATIKQIVKDTFTH